MIIVDAHQHYWSVRRGDYGWLDTAPETLRRDYLPDDLRAQRDQAQVWRTVLVQAAPSEAETRYLFELARSEPSIAGVVGWVDFAASDVRQRIDNLVRDGDGRLLGLRPMAQDIADPDWLARPALDAAFDALQAHDLAFDALVRLDQLPALRQRLSREHSLRAVLDHAGKPDIAHGEFDGWSVQITKLAEHSRLHCKFSGLLTQLAPGQGESAIDRYVEHLFERFGASRLLWGSDWPVLTTQSGYAHWLGLAQSYAKRLAPARLCDIFRGNASAFYRLDTAAPTHPPLDGNLA
ncbi:amidohydrolase family protein [Dyella silvatica]|uniref:amidohydrolase family protein n=1 Tax=Dyella silvatica TaxID=2992128 RepID=UPI00225779A0|nr:amidohydrolase family protein [Dyella silvatica]